MNRGTKIVIGVWTALMVGLVVMLNRTVTFTDDEQYYTVPNLIRVTGETEDGKYKTYDLEGDLHDLGYSSSSNVLYLPDDLPARLPYISKRDVNNGVYTCSFVCKNNQGKIVGLNPAWAPVYKSPLS
jgi:signal peptidase I